MKDLINNYLQNAEEASSESRYVQQKLKIVQIISQRSSPMTVPEISKELKISTPTCIKLVNHLQEEGILHVVGKKETANGRKPLMYSVDKVNFFSVSVEILLKRISFAIIDSGLNIIHYRQKADFALENTPECLEEIYEYVQEGIDQSGIGHDRILGVGIGITGRVSRKTGETFTFFNFLEKPVTTHLEEKFSLPVFVDNDTRCYGLAEKIIGKARDAHNAIIINLSRGLGTTLIINDGLVEGGMGFAGELGHMQFGDSQKLCICGKKGCLGNEVGGYALEEEVKIRIGLGEKSLLEETFSGGKIRYDEILSAALSGDYLAIAVIQEIGQKLGKALGNIVNLLNPEQIIIGGKFSRLGDMLLDPVKAGLLSTGLQNSLKNCDISVSELGDLAGLKGAGALVFEYFELI